MGRLSNSRRKQKAAAARIKLAKSIDENNLNNQSGHDIVAQSDGVVAEPLEAECDVLKSKVEDLGKHAKINKNAVLTRQQQGILKRKEEEKDERRKRVQNAIDQRTENRKTARESLKRRLEINENIHLKRRNIKLAERNKELEAKNVPIDTVINEPSASFCQSLNNDIIDSPNPCGDRNFTDDNEVMQYKGNTVSPKLNAESSARLKNLLGLSNRKYELLSKQDGINVASISTVKRVEANIFDTYYRNSSAPDFYGLLEAAVDKQDFSNLPYIRITICGDKGGDSVKICFFFNDIPYALSVKKLICIHTFVGDESREMLEATMKKIDEDILRLQKDGIATKSGTKNVIFTYVGDCKYLCTSLGLQGGTAIYGCVNCLTKRIDWINVQKEDIIPRTIDNIVSSAYEVIDNNGTSKSNTSVKNYPLIRNIPISNFVPPPVHILISLVNTIIDCVRKFADDSKPLENFLAATGVRLHFPAQSYEGNQCRKIMHNFRADNEKRIAYNGFGLDLFDAASQIESYAVARTLTEAEINGLESSINLFFNLMLNYGNESIHHVRNELDRRIPGTGPQYNDKRNNFFKKNQAVAFHFS
uniref:Uncharacterized protein n=1 Tax=Panagrolaimus sp. ES5 TaxID=591445 RepID=A0AC34G2D0_9BILA